MPVSILQEMRLTEKETKTLHAISGVVKQSCSLRVRGAATSSVVTWMALVTFQVHLSEFLANTVFLCSFARVPIARLPSVEMCVCTQACR